MRSELYVTFILICTTNCRFLRAIWVKFAKLVFQNTSKLSELSEGKLNVFENYRGLIIPNCPKITCSSLLIALKTQELTKNIPETNKEYLVNIKN